ncbi:MAG: ribosome silencing factor [Candidatus Omnitrophica bacterium]|nr:ribosome silencing factor [Candidatus Omnitrophota bacterium]
MGTTTSKDKAYLIARFAHDKKAQDITFLKLQGIVDFTDYFVICHGSSTRNVQAIADGIREGMKKSACRVLHVEGYSEALWILLDYGDVIAHIFYPQTRTFYDLERLWGDAPKEAFQPVQ